MNILTFSTLYPNAAQPHNGVFVENRLRHLVANGNVSARVVAPVPWFPNTARIFGRYAEFAAVPREEERYGLHILHPRYPVIPAVGMNVAPAFLYAFARRAVHQIIGAGNEIDLIDAHYFYPDGVAAALLGRHFAQHVAAFDVALNLDVVPYALALKLFEYLAMGRAIIAHDWPNIREILTDRENAILFDPEKPGAFHAALDHLCRDQALRRRFGENARRTIDEKGLTWEANAKRVEELFSGLIGKS